MKERRKNNKEKNDNTSNGVIVVDDVVDDDDDNTSLITVLSSAHGRIRREQRDIRKRDLKKALKYGTYEKLAGDGSSLSYYHPAAASSSHLQHPKTTQCRWKIEYDGIIFITDSTRRIEITSYPVPQSTVSVDYQQRREHHRTQQFFTVADNYSSICTSHTIFVVDVSGSMNRQDIPLHRDRRTAAYTMIAIDYIAEQILTATETATKATTCSTDVISVIEFQDTATIVYKKEPISWILYNKILARRRTATNRSYHDRTLHQYQDENLVCDSNYLPALDRVQELLRWSSGTDTSDDDDEYEEYEDTHDDDDDCDHDDDHDHDHAGPEVSLVFISDGQPTDFQYDEDVSEEEVKQLLKERILALTTTTATARFSRKQQRLNHLLCIGFGNPLHDFSTLQAMVEAVNTNHNNNNNNNDNNNDTVAKFVYCNNIANSIGTAIASSLAESTTSSLSRIRTTTATLCNDDTNTNEVVLELSNIKRTDIQPESCGEMNTTNNWKSYRIIDHYVYDPSASSSVSPKNLLQYLGLPPGCIADNQHAIVARSMLQQHQNNKNNTVAAVAPEEEKEERLPPFIAINKYYIGNGAERIAYRCNLMNTKGEFRLGSMIGKETVFEQQQLSANCNVYLNYHQSFLTSQSLASYLANEFNKRLRNVLLSSSSFSGLGLRSSSTSYYHTRIPIITFLKCSVLVLDDPPTPSQVQTSSQHKNQQTHENHHRYILVEKQLNTTKFQWTKWNNNNGGIHDGKKLITTASTSTSTNTIPHPSRTTTMSGCPRLGIIKENKNDNASDDKDETKKNRWWCSDGANKDDNSIDYYDEDDDDNVYNDASRRSGASRCSSNHNSNTNNAVANKVKSFDELVPSDYLQAFSHFTYMFTNRKLLVCDLQGVYNTDIVPQPMYELTDPAIHYDDNNNNRGSTTYSDSSRIGRRILDFGRTDKGCKGIQEFFKTHKCTCICKMMQLCKKDTNWTKNWCADFKEDMSVGFYHPS